MNEQFKNRLESFAWRTGMMALASLITFLGDNVGLLQFDPTVTMVLGLVLGEVSKFINSSLKTA